MFESTKLRPLYLMKILLDKTNPQNPMTVPEIIDDLALYGIEAKRRAIYDDLNVLRVFGMDIKKVKSKTVGYYVASRQFALPELKLLVDAVQSSRLITSIKTDQLIQKLASLTSVTQAKQLQRQVFVAGCARTPNESVYDNVDAIYTAINGGKKIIFQYFDYDLQKNRIYRKGGGLYKASPLAMLWNDDKYYLIAHCDEHHEIRHYRVDRMCNVTVLDAEARVMEGFDISEYDKHTFGMYSGELIRADLRFEVSLINLILDKFGWDVTLKPAESGWFEITVDVSFSPVFLGWMFQLGKSAVIKGPAKLIDVMRQHLSENMEIYNRR